MNGANDQLFAGTRFAGDENSDFRIRDAADRLIDLHHCRCPADEDVLEEIIFGSFVNDRGEFL
jgi:hypothetical protein